MCQLGLELVLLLSDSVFSGLRWNVTFASASYFRAKPRWPCLFSLCFPRVGGGKATAKVGAARAPWRAAPFASWNVGEGERAAVSRRDWTPNELP